MALFASLALVVAAAQAPAAAEPVRVEQALFFAIDMRTDPPGIAETLRIPYRPETSCFGWLLAVAPQKGTVTVREELRLPARTPNWGESETSTVHPDGAGATSRIEADLSEGLIANEWCLSPGDPLGAHRVSVYLGDRLLRQFDFEVVPDAEDRTTI